MQFHIISLSFLFWQTFAATVPDPMITAAPFSPTHENLRRQSMLLAQRQLQQRSAPTSTVPQEIIVAELAYCYGENSICAETNVLYDQCDQANPHTLSNYTGMFICECESGYFAADVQCGWCELAFEPYLTFLYGKNEEWSSICSSVSATFAPVPTSAVAVVSAWNATFTGIKSYDGSGGGGATSAPGSGTSKSNSGSISSPTSSRNTFVASISTDTLIGGGVGPTTTPPGSTTSGASQPSSTPNGSSSMKYARGWGISVYLALLGIMIGFLS